MAISEHATGSQTASIGTEHSLVTSPETTDGVYCLVLDLANMAKSDILEIRFYEKARGADTQRLLFLDTLANAQTELLWMSPSVILMNGWNMTIKQTAGTGRAFPWSIRKIA